MAGKSNREVVNQLSDELAYQRRTDLAEAVLQQVRLACPEALGDSRIQTEIRGSRLA
jgi:hypothetical protein